MEHISLIKIRSLARLPVCSNQTGFSLPDSMTRATRMDTDDSLVWEYDCHAGRLSDDNHGASSDIVVKQVCDVAVFQLAIPLGRG